MKISPNSELQRLILEEYLALFEIYNDRFISFPTLFRTIRERKASLTLDELHGALLEMEAGKIFLLGGYTHRDDIREPEFALHLPERGYLYWAFRPEPPDPMQHGSHQVINM